MTSPREWQRIDAALDEILNLPQGDWTEACRRLAGGDEAFRLELESLLAQVGGEDPVLDYAAGSLPGGRASPRVGLPPGARIGAYRVVETLGVGGMGEVYRAERADGQFDHQVAIKLMRREVGDQPQRFHAERQILARLEHPNIAGLHDGGVAADGRPRCRRIGSRTVTIPGRARRSPNVSSGKAVRRRRCRCSRRRVPC